MYIIIVSFLSKSMWIILNTHSYNTRIVLFTPYSHRVKLAFVLYFPQKHLLSQSTSLLYKKIVQGINSNFTNNRPDRRCSATRMPALVAPPPEAAATAAVPPTPAPPALSRTTPVAAAAIPPPVFPNSPTVCFAVDVSPRQLYNPSKPPPLPLGNRQTRAAPTLQRNN